MCQDQSLRNAIFQAPQPASLAVTGGEGETSIPDKLHDHTNHMLVREKPQQLTGEAAVPDSVVCSCQIYKHGTGLLFSLETILDVLRQQDGLTHGRPTASKSSLLTREQGVDNRFDTGKDQPFEDLVGDTEQGDGTVALWVPYRFLWLWDRDYKCSSPDFGNSELAQAGR